LGRVLVIDGQQTFRGFFSISQGRQRGERVFLLFGPYPEFPMRRILLSVLMAGVASSALAADLPTTKGPPPAPYFSPPPAFNWTGFYIGVNGGWGFTQTNNDSFGNLNGGLVGGTVGYNYQMGQFVIGYEGDVDWSDIRGTDFAFTIPGGFGSNKLTSEFMVTERARLGYAWDRTLFYVTGGYAGIDMKGSFNDSFGNFGSQTVWHNGGVVGAGIEYAFTNNITFKGEYLFAPMQSKTYFAGTPDVTSTGLDISMFRAGINYKF
jgi:outer membrane immunogenic protein